MLEKNKFSFPVTTLAGSRLRNLYAICKPHYIDRKYKSKLALTTAASGILEILSSYESLVSRKKISNVQLKEPPVFIIGFWRSGTTLLHNLLCQDSNTAYTTTFQTVFPNLVLTQNAWLKPLANYLGPSKRPFDNVDMDMDFPQEEEFGLMNLQAHSIYKTFLFPENFDQIFRDEVFTEQLPKNELKQWKDHYNNLMAKAILNTGGNTFISKNPCNITRINLLKLMYPGARFIFIYRNPYEVLESLYRFTLGVFPGVQLQQVPKGFSRENVAEMYDLIMRHYLKEREQLNESELIEIKMEDFMKDTKGNLQNIYKQFQLGEFNSVEQKMDTYLGKYLNLSNGTYKINQESIDLVNDKFPDIVKTLGYDIISSAKN